MTKNLLKMRIIIGTLFLIVIHTSIFADTCNLPFPQAQDYPYGLRPNNYTQAQMNQHVQDWFDKWKAKYVANYLTTANGMNNSWMEMDWYRIVRWETGSSDGPNDTVSEGIGYGMVVMVYMSSATNNTQDIFDGLYKFYQAYNSPHNPDLMDWKVRQNGSSIGQGAATDADVDVAFALMMAEKQWGNSSGAFNYHNEAVRIINAMKASEFSAVGDVYPGDGWTDPKNPCYFTPAYLRMYADYTGDTFWDSAAARSYNTFVKYYYNSSDTYDSGLGLYTGLQPNWCGTNGGESSPGDWSMSWNSYWWDACRVPWRQGYDYVLYGTLNHQLALDNTARISEYFKAK